MRDATPRNRRTLTNRQKKVMWFYIFVTPFIVGFIAFIIVPAINSIYYSMTNYNGLNYNNAAFTGIKNYIDGFKDSIWWSALGRTLLYGVFLVPIGGILCLLFAMLLQKSTKYNKILRTLFYLPVLIPIFASGTVFVSLFNSNSGLINHIITLFGGTPVTWNQNSNAWKELAVFLIWRAVGGTALIINIAALKAVPEELYEAGLIEGATGWKKFSKITFPLITHAVFFNLIMGVIYFLQTFLEPLILSGSTMTGVPPQSTYLAMNHIVQQLFGNMRFGYGLALNWILIVVIAILTVIVFRTSKYWVYSESDS